MAPLTKPYFRGSLSAFGGGESWEPWFTRYASRNPAELRDASSDTLAARMDTAGTDMRDVLARADALGPAIAAAVPVATLRRVFSEQFEEREGAAPSQRRAPLPGAAASPHDPDAQWSTKKTLGKEGWKGYKAHVCETVHDEPRRTGEPTRSAITAIHVVPATASDHGAATPVLALHAATTGDAAPPAEALADAGYISAPALLAAAAAGCELSGPVPAPPHSAGRHGTDAFAVDIPARSATCPAGHASSECSRIADARHGVKYWFAWPAAACAACGLRDRCLPKKGAPARRSIEVGEHHMPVQARRDLCKTEEYRVRMRRRNAIEGTHSELARGYGFRRCRYRGLPKTQLQAHFTATAYNISRWARRTFAAAPCGALITYSPAVATHVLPLYPQIRGTQIQPDISPGYIGAGYCGLPAYSYTRFLRKVLTAK